MFAELRSQIKSFCAKNDAAGLLTCAELEAASTDIGAALEISFRNEARLFSLQKEKEFLSMLSLLRFSIQFAKLAHELSPNVGKIPFLLISDVLERETIAVAERVWSTVEELADDLTAPVLFSKGKMTVLRFCNALLRRLSKSCNTEFCGRILMFLAAIYPLSERSAVNISGKSNTSNLTSYEDAENFETRVEAAESADMDVEEEGVGGEAGALLGLAREQFAASGGPDQVASDSREDAVAAVDYNLYKMFWGIQNFVAGDPVKAAAISPAALTDFSGYVDTLLSAFEANAFTDSELEQSLHSWEHLQRLAISHTNRTLQLGSVAAPQQADLAGAGRDDSYAGCKYLTSSQLFALQLKDPVIREQVTTQLLFHLHYVKDRLPAGAEELSVLAKIEKRITAILRKTPPNGAHYLKSLQTLLDREQHWSAWKKKGCQPFERAQPEEGQEAAPASRKRRRDDAGGKATGPAKAGFALQIDPSALKSTLETISGKIPTFDAHMEPYIEAEDPDAGIEDEYHPKNDKVYCWRARRLLANKKLAAFEDMADGDVGKGLKKMQKMLHPQAAGGGEGGGKKEAAVPATAPVEEEPAAKQEE